MNQDIKKDAGKLEISLVPMEILRDIAYIRMYGRDKYGDAENWRSVEVKRYIDALDRHIILFNENPKGTDEESGYPHLWHVACNVAFLCELMKEDFGAECCECAFYKTDDGYCHMIDFSVPSGCKCDRFKRRENV